MSLITTIAELKQYILIEDNAKIKTLQPFIDQAEQLYIIDLLGKDFYDEFLPLYIGSVASSPVALSDDNKKLLPYIQRCQSYYAQLLAIDQLSVTFGELGIRVHRSEDSDAASDRKTEKLQVGALKNGDIHADKLLEFLEQNATPNPTEIEWTDALTFKLDGSGDGKFCIQPDTDDKVRYWQTKIDDNINNQPPTDPLVDEDANWIEIPAGVYTTWYSSTANTKNSGFIIYSTAIASKHIDIGTSRRLFIKLRAKIQDVEKRIIPKLVSPEQYAELVDHLKANTLTDQNKALIELVEPIVCKRALYMQLPFLSISVAADGLWLYSDFNQLRDRWFLATDDDEDDLRCHLKDEKDFGYLADEQRLRAFMLDNIEDYPKIKASSIYTVQPKPGPTFQPHNCPDNKHFIV
jgi:hypothetical protein